MCGLLRNRRFFDCAPCGRFAQNDILVEIGVVLFVGIYGLLRNRGFFDSLRSLRMTSWGDQSFAFACASVAY